jgi:hypothetical protein
MKYMLMMAGTRPDFDSYLKLSKEELQAQVAFMRSFAKELGDSGVLVLTEGLAFPDQAKLVRAGSKGEPITDGVFPNPRSFSPDFGLSTWRVLKRPTGSPPGRRLRRA